MTTAPEFEPIPPLTDAECRERWRVALHEAGQALALAVMGIDATALATRGCRSCIPARAMNGYEERVMLATGVAAERLADTLDPPDTPPLDDIGPYEADEAFAARLISDQRDALVAIASEVFHTGLATPDDIAAALAAHSSRKTR